MMRHCDVESAYLRGSVVIPVQQILPHFHDVLEAILTSINFHFPVLVFVDQSFYSWNIPVVNHFKLHSVSDTHGTDQPSLPPREQYLLFLSHPTRCLKSTHIHCFWSHFRITANRTDYIDTM